MEGKLQQVLHQWARNNDRMRSGTIKREDLKDVICDGCGRETKFEQNKRTGDWKKVRSMQLINCIFALIRSKFPTVYFMCNICQSMFKKSDFNFYQIPLWYYFEEMRSLVIPWWTKKIIVFFLNSHNVHKSPYTKIMETWITDY